jgi:hypothetical protein
LQLNKKLQPNSGLYLNAHSISAIQVNLRDFVNIKVQFDIVQTEIEAVDDEATELEHENNNRQTFQDLYSVLYESFYPSDKQITDYG